MSADSSSSPVSPHKGASEAKAAAGRWPWHPLTAIAAVIITFVLSQLAAVIISGVLTDVVFPHADDTVSQFLVIGLAESLVILGVYGIFRNARVPFSELGFTRPQARDVWMPAVGFVVYFGLFVTLSMVIKALVPGLDLNQKQDIGFNDASGMADLTLVFLALVVLAPLAEEILFRGFLFGTLRRKLSFAAATLITSLLFGAAHLMGGEQGAALLWIAGIDTLLLSTVLCYLREHTGRLWGCVLLHATKNCVAFMLLFVYGMR